VPSTKERSVLPYCGEFGETLDLERLATTSEAGSVERMLAAVLADPHLAELDQRDMRLAEALRDHERGTFEAAAFLERGRLAIAGYVRHKRPWLRTVFVRDDYVEGFLDQKIVSLACALTSLRDAAPAPPPLAAAERVKALFGRRASRLPLTPVRGATVLRSEPGQGGSGRYAFRLSTPADPPSGSLGTARPGFGRAVFVEDVHVDARTGAVLPPEDGRRAGRIPTEIVVKGVGRTPFAGNRFSLRASGALTLHQGQRDWAHSEALASGGVPVYRPLELTLLPYCLWHPSTGWRPIVVYARLPLENLRISDLALLSRAMRRRAMATLRVKLAALAGVPPRRISGAEVVRFVVARLGRVAGLCASGCTFGGRPFFHASLHEQNVSLLGELVDLGEGRFVADAAELRAEYASSTYANPLRAWPASVRLSTREAACFKHAAHLFAVLAATVLEPDAARGRPELNALFWRSHREGADGLRADDVGGLLGA
jgi:Protein adenylyltransferase SelO